ncbi:MAG: FdrA family protein, partial [Chloroflexi bacterium]|nr:FdrA family protein [Chloroflexota bacterium]
MTITKSEIRPGAYFDSVLLMLLQRGLSELPGVEDAGVVMATPANLALLDESNLLTKDGEAGKPDDLLIVVRAKDEKSATEALAEFDSLIKKRKSNVASDFYPKSLVMANKQLPEANWVLISVPGRYAAEVADQALDIGKNVFLYSDNVSIEEEIDLK